MSFVVSSNSLKESKDQGVDQYYQEKLVKSVRLDKLLKTVKGENILN